MLTNGSARFIRLKTVDSHINFHDHDKASIMSDSHYENSSEFTPPKQASVTDYFFDRSIKLVGQQGETGYQEKIKKLNSLAKSTPEVIAEIGLKCVEIPEDIHAVTRENNLLGDFYCPDMIMECLDDNGVQLREHDKALDFGCSSGRVIRTLQAFAPHLSWYGCDPRATSIKWVGEIFPEINFFKSNERPPLKTLDDSTFRLVYAISVWSHFSRNRALDWFNEMARIIQHDGILLFTTHGLRSIHHFAEVKCSMPATKAEERLQSMRHGDYHFMPYGSSSPSMVELDSNKDWGLAFAPRSWYESNLSDNWKLLQFKPGRLLANQDVYVFQRLK